MVDHVKLSTYVISVLTALAGFVFLYPDAFNYLISPLHLDARVITAIVYFAALIYNGKFQAPKTEDPDPGMA